MLPKRDDRLNGSLLSLPSSLDDNDEDNSSGEADNGDHFDGIKFLVDEDQSSTNRPFGRIILAPEDDDNAGENPIAYIRTLSVAVIMANNKDTDTNSLSAAVFVAILGFLHRDEEYSILIYMSN